MGIIWRSIMPLLSTLAALVIIVHSAEEDMEYRQDLRPRVLDTGEQIYNQPWRVVESEPTVLKSTQSHTWNDDLQDDIPRRRRPRRKRKRRPTSPDERYVFPEEPSRPYFDLDQSSYTTTEEPKRRRKKLEPNEWEGEITERRPMKRRGMRRRRPTSNNWPEINEYNANPPEETPVEVVIDNNDSTPDQIKENKQRNRFVTKNKSEANDDHFVLETGNEEFIPQIQEVRNTRVDKTANIDTVSNAEDKPSSELSYEVAPKVSSRLDGKLNKERSSNESHGNDKVQDNYVDPMTIKNILKRSNGTSLSEVLQQHNLTLLDLLHGNEKAIAILKSESSSETQLDVQSEKKNEKTEDQDLITNIPENNGKEDGNIQEAVRETTEFVTEVSVTTTELNQEDQETKLKMTTELPTTTTTQKVVSMRRFTPLVRRKLRMRPMLNTTVTAKTPVNKNLLTLNARKYANQRRNFTKMNEWKNIFPTQVHVTTERTNEKDIQSTTTTATTEEMTTQQVLDNETTKSSNSIVAQTEMSIPLNTLFNNQIGSDNMIRVTEAPTITPSYRYSVNASLARRQALNNRLKKKRLRQKSTTTEPPEGEFLKHLFSMDSVSTPPEIVTKAQTITTDNNDLDLELADFITARSTRVSSYTLPPSKFLTTTELPETTEPFTEETAKIEIEEILNDTSTSQRLSKILMERNMSFDELLAHRERGSSHVHLADIFHNASKEPNPPEPFLSKSLIEPISKETYPLRAILEANSHEVTVKSTTVEPSLASNHINVPIALDFGNNVNEHAENMGIMSLFQNLSNTDLTIKKDFEFKQNFEGKPYESNILDLNVTQSNDTVGSTREGRTFGESKEDDVVSWNQIFTLMKKSYENQTGNMDPLQEESPAQSVLKPVLEEDVDGDGLIVLEDLQQLRELDNNISPDYNEFSPYGRKKDPRGGHETLPSQTKSVTVATASIAGLAVVLFLLTYAVFKWKHQKCMSHGTSTICDQRIPTPVFESRKSQRHSSSTRSISPMLSANIYTLNTMDSRNGQESPEYMWDSLRKPFQ